MCLGEEGGYKEVLDMVLVLREGMEEGFEGFCILIDGEEGMRE